MFGGRRAVQLLVGGQHGGGGGGGLRRIGGVGAEGTHPCAGKPVCLLAVLAVSVQVPPRGPFLQVWVLAPPERPDLDRCLGVIDWITKGLGARSDSGSVTPNRSASVGGKAPRGSDDDLQHCGGKRHIW